MNIRKSKIIVIESEMQCVCIYSNRIPMITLNFSIETTPEQIKSWAQLHYDQPDIAILPNT